MKRLDVFTEEEFAKLGLKYEGKGRQYESYADKEYRYLVKKYDGKYKILLKRKKNLNHQNQ